MSNAGTRDAVATILTGRVGLLLVTGIAGGPGPITGLQVTVAAAPGGQHVPLLTDSDFTTATDTLLWQTGLSGAASPNTPANIPAANGDGATGIFQFLLQLHGEAEVNVRAKSANGATLALEVKGVNDSPGM